MQAQFTADDVKVTVINDSQDPTEHMVVLVVGNKRLGNRCKATVEFFKSSERNDDAPPFIYVHMFVEFFAKWGSPLARFDVNVGDLYDIDDESGLYDYEDAVQSAIAELLPIASAFIQPDTQVIITIDRDSVIQHVEDTLGIELTPEMTAWLDANVDLGDVADSFDNDFMADECSEDLADGMSGYLDDFRKEFNISEDGDDSDDSDDE